MTDQQDRLERLETSLCKTMAGFLVGLRFTGETKGNNEMTMNKEASETQAGWGPMDVIRHALVNIAAYSTDPGARATADDAINALRTINAPLSASAEPVATVCYRGDRYASGNMIEVQLQIAPGTVLPIGTKLYAHAPPPAIAEPVAWIRYLPDGLYEGPIHSSEFTEYFRKSGKWTPLCVQAPPASCNPTTPETLA